MPYIFDTIIKTKNFEVRIDTAEKYGYFEHDRLGDERGGGLWFQIHEISKPDGSLQLELTDYDGVAVLPKEVRQALRENGFVVSEDFDC